GSTPFKRGSWRNRARCPPSSRSATTTTDAPAKPKPTAFRGPGRRSIGKLAKLVTRRVPLKNNTARRKVTSTLTPPSRDHADDKSIQTSSGAKPARGRMLFTRIDELSWRETIRAAQVSTSMAATVASDAAYISGPRDKHRRPSAMSLVRSRSLADLAWDSV